MALDRSLRNEAIGLWVRCGAWSAQEETDGRVPLDTVKSFDGTPRLIRALHQQAGLWGDENPEISPESWRNSREILFKSWEKWQKTRAENIAKRKADALRQSSSRRAKKGRNYVPESELNRDDSEMSRCDTDRDSIPDETVPANSCHTVSHGVSHSAPTQTRPDPLSIETSKGEGDSGDAHDPRPQCPDHEQNSDTPCPACRRRREWDKAHEVDELNRKRAQRQALIDTVKACTECDEFGRTVNEDGDITGFCELHPRLKDVANA